jgi:hypothetical protein
MATKQPAKQPKNRNLRGPRWQKGCPSPNPKGRPRTRHLSKAAAEWLAEGERETNARAIVEAIGARALKGDLACAAWLADRTEGRPHQSLAITEDNETRVRAEIDRLISEGWSEDEARGIVDEAREGLYGRG